MIEFEKRYGHEALEAVSAEYIAASDMQDFAYNGNIDIQGFLGDPERFAEANNQVSTRGNLLSEKKVVAWTSSVGVVSLIGFIKAYEAYTTATMFIGMELAGIPALMTLSAFGALAGVSFVIVAAILIRNYVKTA